MIQGGDSPQPAALELRGIRKRFGDVVALDGVDLVVARGSVHALLGENGAGKSTLMRIAFGLTAPDAGEVRIFGEYARLASVRDRAGVGMVHQHLSLAPNLTAAENLVLGGSGAFRRVDAEALLRRVSEASGLAVPSGVPAAELSIVEQQRLEILKALARDARLLILDEPTAVLAPSEADDLLRWVRTFVTSGGSVVLVTHKLRQALAVADDITVLRHGAVTFAGRASTSSESALTSAVFPEAVATSTALPDLRTGDAVARALDATIVSGGRPRIRGAGFTLRRGEIIGIAAVEGAGHRELLRALAGLLPIATGSLSLPKQSVFIPADRQRDAIIPAFTLAENVALRDIGRAKGRLDWPAIAARTAALVRQFGIVAPSPAVPALALSGGNQQRLVVARSLEGPVDLLIADNPTRGLDLQATAFVHEQLRRAAAAGAAVVVHSSDLDEVLALATRVLVVFHGTVSEVAADRGLIGKAMLGAA